MYHLKTQITINAPAEKVWLRLMDFPAYVQWNPFIRSIEGKASVGQSLKVFLQPADGRGMRFSPTVLVANPNREFRWKGKLFVSGIFDGEHYFLLEPQPQGGVIFQQGELFSGLLVPLLKGSLENGTRKGFAAMNEALKREAEKP
jgi:hypothetical protein